MKDKMRQISICLVLFLLGVYLATAQNQGDLKFTGTGSTKSKGRVQIYYDGKWNTICAAQVTLQVAEVICRQLGFSPVTAKFLSDPFGPVPTTLPQKQIVCDGSEKTITACAIKNADTVCTHNLDVRLECQGNQAGGVVTTVKPDTGTLKPVTCKTSGDVVKLEGGPSSTEGRVMIKYNTEWGAICDDDWGENDAKVVCNMLCSNNAQPTALTGVYTAGVTKIWLTNVQCKGDEKDISRCPHSGWGNHNCKLTEVASVRCAPVNVLPPAYPQPDVTCTGKSIIAIFSIKNFPTVKPQHITLLVPDSGCGFTSEWHKTDKQRIVATIPLNACGTTITTKDNKIQYRNNLIQKVPDVGQTIDRIQQYQVPVICATPTTATVPPKPIKPVIITVPPREGNLNLKFDLNYNKNGKPITSGQVVLGTDYNVQVDLETQDGTLKMVVTGCYAQAGQTSTTHQLIANKCKRDSTVKFQPKNATSFSFNMQSFKFKKYPDAQIYTHCSVNVCQKNKKTSECDQTCGTRRRKREADISRSESPAAVTRTLVFEGLTVKTPEGDGWIVVEEDEIIRYIKAPLESSTSTLTQPETSTTVPTQPPVLVFTHSPQETMINNSVPHVPGAISKNTISIKQGTQAISASSQSILSAASLAVSLVTWVMVYVIWK